MLRICSGRLYSDVVTTDNDGGRRVRRRRASATKDVELATPEGRFGQIVRRLRRAADMSQAVIADELSARGVPMTQMQMSRLEAGTRPIRLNEAIALAEVFRIAAGDLLGSV